MLLCYCLSDSAVFPAGGPPPQRRGRGGGHRGRGRFNPHRDGPMKFDQDFDFETANAQFNKEEIEKEFQSKLKLKGTICNYYSMFHAAVMAWPSLGSYLNSQAATVDLELVNVLCTLFILLA